MPQKKYFSIIRLKVLCLKNRNPNHEPEMTNKTLKLWDAPTRIFHWGLVALVFTQIIVGFNGYLPLHFRLGAAIFSFLLFRFFWGFVGSSSALFKNFITGYKPVLEHFAYILKNQKHPTFGHNPVGGWVILVMLGLLFLQIITGLCAFTLAPFIGMDLSELAANLHRFGARVIIAMIALHLSAQMFYWIVRGENLIFPMFTGEMEWEGNTLPPEVKFARPEKALALASLALILTKTLLSELF